jgi:hypothetical protein
MIRLVMLVWCTADGGGGGGAADVGGGRRGGSQLVDTDSDRGNLGLGPGPVLK